jgi:predicted Zn-dependent protease with MMP-like domain
MAEPTMLRTPLLPPSEDLLAALAEEALEAIPARLARHLAGVGILIDDFPDATTCEEMGLESEWDLTGLYRGTPLGHKSIDDPARPPDTIHLYRMPILLEWIETGVDLRALVRNVVVHEIAHHFGFSDAEIAALEAEMEGGTDEDGSLG